MASGTAFLRSMSASAAASSARWAADVSHASCRFLTTFAGAPTAIEKSGMSPLTTACEPSTHPRPIVVLRRMVTLVAIQVSGPIRTGPLRMPWSLIGMLMSSILWSKSHT